MALNINDIILMVIPWVKLGLMVLSGGGIAAGLGWYLFIYKGKKRWVVRVWEKKGDGQLYYIEKDLLVEQKFNKGKQRAYILKKGKVETIPPPIDCINRMKNKDYVDYLRVLDDYTPLQKSVEMPESYNETVNEEHGDKKFNKWKKVLRDKIDEIKRLTAREVDNKYLFAPMKTSVIPTFKYAPMDYDVNMMRINAIDNREKIYSDSKDFWDRYGHMISVGAVLLLAIVVIYMSYGYSETVVERIAGIGNNVGANLGVLIEKLGGTPPPG